MKKFFAILLSAMLMLSLAVPAMAAASTITVKNAKPGETYKAYKMFDLSVDSETNPTAYRYTVNTAWAAFFGAGGAGNEYITIENGYVTAISDAEALAKAAAAWNGKPTEAASDTVGTGEATAELSVQENGYWLITSTLGTFAMIETTPDDEAVEVNEKNPEDTIKKEVKEDSTDTYGASNDAQVGDTIEFKSTVTLVKGTRNVVVHDAMDDGLTLNVASIKIEGLTEGTDYTVKTSGFSDVCDFEITFTESYLNDLTESTNLTLTYSAVLNENAVKDNNIVDQKNKTTITYGDNQSVESDTTTTTHKFNVFKHAKDSTDNLADAVFSLKKNGAVVKLIKLDDNNYRVANGEEAGAVDIFTTVASGDIVIWGVDADDDYTLEEITPPDGYNKLTAEVSVTVDAGNSTRVDILNQSGTELPSTGGMGTTIFYTVGGLMVVAAVVLLVTKKRMSAEG